jgi:prevent-host-death family protein
MDSLRKKGAEEARNQLPELLDDAERGRTTIITRRGRPVAALIPVADLAGSRQQEPITALRGSGRGFWGPDSAATLRDLRDEWGD